MTKLHSFVTKTVVHISRADLLTNAQENVEHFGPLQIIFADNSCMTIDENGDAESISISDHRLHFDNNSWKEITLDKVDAWATIINSKLLDLSFLQNSFNGRQWTCGCKLTFDSGVNLTYFNYYDDSKVVFNNNELLTSFIEYEGLTWSDTEIEAGMRN